MVKMDSDNPSERLIWNTVMGTILLHLQITMSETLTTSRRSKYAKINNAATDNETKAVDIS